MTSNSLKSQIARNRTTIARTPAIWGSVMSVNKAQRDAQNPKAWDVQVPVKDPDDGKTYAVWLHLEFELPLPALADWPKAP